MYGILLYCLVFIKLQENLLFDETITKWENDKQNISWKLYKILKKYNFYIKINIFYIKFFVRAIFLIYFAFIVFLLETNECLFNRK